MIRNWLMTICLLLVALQLTAIPVDTHQMHQSGSEHLVFEHEHQAKSKVSITEKNNTVSYDCHHCCHCHGGGSIYLGTQANDLVAFDLRKSLRDYRRQYISYLFPPELRPPIV